MTLRIGWQGRFFEDFTVGDIYQHPLGRTLSEADNTWFTLVTMNTAQLHFNSEAAAQGSEFGKVLINSALTLAISLGQSVIDTSQNAIANLGWEEVVLSHPVFTGDTLWSESIVIRARESRSRPDAGVVTIKTRTVNQHGEIVLSCLRTFLVHRRSAADSLASFPSTSSPFSEDGPVRGQE